MKITVEIDEEELQKCVTDLIAQRFAKEYTSDKVLMRSSIDSAIKNVVYSQKEELINKCVERASIEIAKKAMPKLVEKMMK